MAKETIHESITVRERKLVDSKGRLRAWLACLDNDTVTFSMIDKQGFERLVIEATDERQIIGCLNRDGQTVVSIGVAAAEGRHGLEIRDNKGYPRVLAFVHPDNSVQIDCLSDDGKLAWSAP